MEKDLETIIENYGVLHQLKHFQSEVYELTEAIFQYDAQKEACENIGCSRLHVDKCKDHIAEEIADVQVMLNQFKVHYGITNKELVDVMKFKIERQLGRIKNEK